MSEIPKRYFSADIPQYAKQAGAALPDAENVEPAAMEFFKQPKRRSH
jgi:hypothetical protein